MMHPYRVSRVAMEKLLDVYLGQLDQVCNGPQQHGPRFVNELLNLIEKLNLILSCQDGSHLTKCDTPLPVTAHSTRVLS